MTSRPPFFEARVRAVAGSIPGGGESAAAEVARQALRRAATHLVTTRATCYYSETNDDWDPNGLGFDRKLNLSKMGPSPPRVA